MPKAAAISQEILDGQYRLIRLIGEGGMGSVYLARDVFEEDKEYALKVLRPDLGAEVEAFRREFELLAEFRHPHIARVFTFGTILDSGLNYYTTEFIDGTDFYSAVREQNWETLLDLIVQVCSALDYLHGRGILHRDLKPENILVKKDSLGKLQAKLCDFGLAMRGQSNGLGFCGSVDYAAPELLKGEPVDQRTDLYALGVSLYRAVTGRFPFPSNDIAEGLRMRLEVRPPRPSKYNESLPEPLEEIVLSLLEPNPEERPPGARAVIERLAEELNLPLTVDSPENLRATVYCGRYIERTGELRDLKRLVADFLSRGSSSIVLIRGPFGSGKTRLLEEWRTLCELEGSPFYTARAREGEPLFILRSWLRQLFGEPTGAKKDKNKSKLLEKYDRSLPLVLPSFYPSGKKSPSSPLAGQGHRLRLYEDLYQVFRHLLAKQPAILAADDLHLADPLTLEALRYMLQAKVKPRAVWALALGDSSDAEERDGHQRAHSGLSPDQLRVPATREIKLGGFNDDQVGQYLEHVFAGQQPPPDFCTHLIKNTGGIPLFIEESLFELLNRGEIKHHLGAWTFPSEVSGLSIARGFRDFLERRLQTVSEEARQLLRIASLAEGDLPGDMIAALVGKLNTKVQTLFERLCQDGLILQDDVEGQLRVRLAHRALAEQLGAEIPDHDKRQLRLKIAEKLQESRPSKIWAGEIARQLFAAGEVAQVPDWALRAADIARSSFRNEQALDYYRLGLEALERSSGSLGLQGQIRLAISELENLAGRIPEAIQELKDFDDQHGHNIESEQRAKLMENLAIAYERKGDLPEALDCWDAALAQKLGGERARMMGNVGWIKFRQGDVKEALVICQNSLRDLEKIRDTSGQDIIHNTLGRICFYSGDLEAAQQHWSQCLKLRKIRGDKKGLAGSHNNLGIVFSSRGEVENAKRHFEMALDLSREVGDFLRMNGLLVNLGIMAFEAGDLDLAERRYSEALEFFRRSGGDRELLDCLNNLGEICLLRAEFGDARSYWEECISLCSATGYVQGTLEPLIYLGALHIATHCIEAGRDYLDRAWKAAEGTQALKEQALIEEQRGIIALRERQFEQAKDHFEGALKALSEMKLTFLSSRLKLRLAELAWYEGRRNDYSSILETVEKELQSQESQWLRAELNRLKGFDLRSDYTEEALDSAIELGQPFPDLLWRAYWLKGRYNHHRRRYGPAGQNYQKAVDTVKKVFQRMPNDLKSGYSQHPEILLLRDNATKLKAEIVSARRSADA